MCYNDYSKTKEKFQMKLVFRITYYLIENNRPCVKFASTLEIARAFVENCKDGKDFKITPIKLK
jgi:hypothetical protein